MRTQNTVRMVKTRSYILAAILFMIVALGAVMLMFRGSSGTAVAESGGSVTIHVYDPTEKYDDLGAWVWLRGGQGTEYSDFAVLSGEEFGKADLNNTAHSVTATFTADEVAKFKGDTEMGFLICISTGRTGTDFWDRYEKEGSDVFVDISEAFDSNNHADVYYLRKDNIAYTNVEEAKMALEKVTSARFTAKTSTSVTVEFEATSPLTVNTDVELYKDGELVNTVKAQPNAENRFKATAVFGGVTFEFSAQYEIKVVGIPSGASVSASSFIDDIDFITQFESLETQNTQFGSFYTPEKTTFRVWAPFASLVRINIYRDGMSGGAYLNFSMKKAMGAGGTWGGVWEQELSGDYLGMFYTYTVSNPGAVVETVDPYAKAAGANGLRGMIVDLDKTDPVGWENDTHLSASSNPQHVANADVPIVWEVHVQDFSASPDSGMKYKGKYLAFTETGTTVPGKPLLKTGVDYLKELGITYVHLNPVYDFATVDESDMSVADDTKDTFNWGYDPQNYNVPEGSYSTDPSDGRVRIKEFKQMVMALHNAGIGVIMDVVYNHTYSTNGQSLNDTVPNYYHRTKADGELAKGSGCGNETASERTMMRKYMIDSLKYWATEYHIDGFRFDLMGLHDAETMKQIRLALDEISPKLLMYGEPWSGEFGSLETPASFTARLNATANGIGLAKNPVGNKMIKFNDGDFKFLHDRVAVFGDSGRSGLRGGNGNDLGPGGDGWVQGNNGGIGGVQKMMEGYCGGSGAGIVTSNGSQGVAYASAHDNYTLWDQLCGKGPAYETSTFFNEVNPTRIKQCKLVASSLMMSSGIVFMLAGDEMGRTKYGNHNSYNSSTKLNQIVWSRQEDFKDLHDYYQTVIKIRKDNRATFAYSKTIDDSKCTGNFTGTEGSVIVFTTHDGALKCTLNGYSKTGTITDKNGQVKASF